MPLPDLNSLDNQKKADNKENSEEKEMTEAEEEEALLKKTLMIRLEMTDRPEEFEQYYQMSQSINPYDLRSSMNEMLPKRTRKKPTEEQLKKMKKIRERRRKRYLEEQQHLIDNKK